MEDYNRNRSRQNTGYHNDWDQDRWRYENENRHQNRPYGNVNYGQGYNQDRGDYNRHYENDYSQGGYGVSNRNYGPYGDYTSRRQEDDNRSYGHAGYGGDEYGAPEAFSGNREFYGGGYGYMGGYDYRIANDNYNQGNRQQRGHAGKEDRDWWDRAKEKVSSWLGGDEEERRQQGNQRTAVSHKGKGPRGYTRSSERIKEDVCERLSEDAFVDASDIEIKMEGSEVILSGTVHSREEKRRAEDLVERIPGVTNVQNLLRVQRQEYASASDQHLSDNYRRP